MCAGLRRRTPVGACWPAARLRRCTPVGACRPAAGLHGRTPVAACWPAAGRRRRTAVGACWPATGLRRSGIVGPSPCATYCQCQCLFCIRRHWLKLPQRRFLFLAPAGAAPGARRSSWRSPARMAPRRSRRPLAPLRRAPRPNARKNPGFECRSWQFPPGPAPSPHSTLRALQHLGGLSSPNALYEIDEQS